MMAALRMPDNKIVQGLWFYGDLPLLQQISIASFLANASKSGLQTKGRTGFLNQIQMALRGKDEAANARWITAV